MDAAGRTRGRSGRDGAAFRQSVRSGTASAGLLRPADGHRIPGRWLRPGRARAEYVYRRLLSATGGRGDPHAQCAARSRHRPCADLRADLRASRVLVGAAAVDRRADPGRGDLCRTFAFTGRRPHISEPRARTDHPHDPTPVLDLCRFRVGLRDLRNHERQLGERLSFHRPRGFGGTGGVGADGVLGQCDGWPGAVRRRGTVVSARVDLPGAAARARFGFCRGGRHSARAWRARAGMLWLCRTGLFGAAAPRYQFRAKGTDRHGRGGGGRFDRLLPNGLRHRCLRRRSPANVATPHPGQHVRGDGRFLSRSGRTLAFVIIAKRPEDRLRG